MVTESNPNAAQAALDSATAKPAAAPAKKPKIRSIVIDTLTAIMKNQVYDTWGEGAKVNYDDWKDYGIELNNFVRKLVDLGFTCVGICGYEGTGKTYGMKFLKPGTNLYFNCDNKELTYKGGRAEYGMKTKPTYLHKLPKSYEEILDKVNDVVNKGMLDENPIAFLMMHVEDYKSADGKVRQRAKVMGKVSKNGLDDMLIMNYYTELLPNGSGADYKLRTQNTGSNTGRTMEGQHGDDTLIDNNFQLIIDAYDNY